MNPVALLQNLVGVVSGAVRLFFARFQRSAAQSFYNRTECPKTISLRCESISTGIEMILYFQAISIWRRPAKNSATSKQSTSRSQDRRTLSERQCCAWICRRCRCCLCSVLRRTAAALCRTRSILHVADWRIPRTPNRQRWRTR